MGSWGRPIRISVLQLPNKGSKTDKRWAKGNLGKDNVAKDNDKARAASNNVLSNNVLSNNVLSNNVLSNSVQMACKALRAVSSVADRKVGVRAWNNEGRKAGANEAAAVVRAAAGLAIPSSWLLMQTATANCRPARSRTRPHH